MHQPDLENISIPLIDRYNQFIEWVTQQNFLNSDYLANKLEVKPGIVDLFFRLEEFDNEEFKTIDEQNIDVDLLYLIVHYKAIIRKRIYSKIESFKKEAQPATAIRDFVAMEVIGAYEAKLQSISSEYWYSIYNYLKGRDIKEGPINKSFPNLILSLGKSRKQDRQITKGQLNWLSQGIVYDSEYELGIFLNDQVNAKNNKDCAIIEEVSELIQGLVS